MDEKKKKEDFINCLIDEKLETIQGGGWVNTCSTDNCSTNGTDCCSTDCCSYYSCVPLTGAGTAAPVHFPEN